MDFTGKISAGMVKCKKAMKNSADNFKLEGMIAEQKKIEKTMRKEIAQLVLTKLEAGEVMSPEIMERYQVILEARAAIEVLEKDRKTSKVICPECGTKCSAKMNYCGKCGAQLPKEEDNEDEQEECVLKESLLEESVVSTQAVEKTVSEEENTEEGEKANEEE